MTNICYKLLALLYENLAGEGYLDLQDAGIPWCSDPLRKEIAHAVRSGASNTECFKLIGILAREYGVNSDFCDKIKSSPSLRFMLCMNLHDAGIDEIITDGNDLEFLINCGDCMGKPIMNGFMQTKISVKFLGIKNFVFLEDINHLKDFDYVTHDISYDEDGGFIIIKIRLVKQKDGNLAYRDIVIYCDDIVIEGLSHEL